MTVSIGTGRSYQSSTTGAKIGTDISSFTPDINVAHFDEAFPSEKFREAVASLYDWNYDGLLERAEAQYVSSIYLNGFGKQVTTLAGIEFLPNLIHLEASGCQIDSVDLASNPKLEYVDLSNNEMNVIDVSTLTGLRDLNVANNILYYIDLSNNPALFSLNVSNNDLIAVDVSDNPALYDLNISKNDISKLDVSMLPDLQILTADQTSLSKLDVSGNPELVKLSVKGSGSLNKLNLSANPDLEKLYCYGTRISLLNLVDNPYLRKAYEGSCASDFDTDILKGYYQYENISNGYTLCVDYGIRIATKDLTAGSVTSIPAQTYKGTAIKPAVQVSLNGKTLVKGTDYKVSYSNNIDVGTATVKITGLDNYVGTITKSFKINPKKITPAVTLSKTAYTYNGSAKTPGVTVKDGTKVLTKNTDYTVTYASGRKNVGTYKVTVKLKGNYSGSKTVSFKIDPKGTSIESLTAGTKKMVVKWKKQAEQTSGYQIQYSRYSDFSSSKKADITSRNSVKKTINELTAGKKYYVRIRTYKTVSGKTYYSAWSATKSVKIAK